MDKLTVILRTCDKVEKFSSPEPHKPRPFGSKLNIIKQCFSSIISSIGYCLDRGIDVSLYVVDDHSSQPIKDFINLQVENFDIKNFKFIELEDTGNGASLKKCYEIGRDECEGAIFFIEDDYLFEISGIYECFMAQKDFSNKNNQPVVIHPVDYIDRYIQPYPCYVALGMDRHWRSIRHTTGTFLITREILVDQWPLYMAFTNIGRPGISEDTTINKVYDKYLCLSPIPTLAEHFQEDFTLTAYCSLKKKNA